GGNRRWRSAYDGPPSGRRRRPADPPSPAAGRPIAGGLRALRVVRASSRADAGKDCTRLRAWIARAGANRRRRRTFVRGAAPRRAEVEEQTAPLVGPTARACDGPVQRLSVTKSGSPRTRRSRRG